MNNYSLRAELYKYEFNTTKDFELIRSVLARSIQPLAEIPCGSGRLIQLHEKHTRDVYMIDQEISMISHCQEFISDKELSLRIFPIVDDLRYWKAKAQLSLILVPTGGMQLLHNTSDFKLCISNLSDSIALDGLIYIDIAVPWNCKSSAEEILPEFMRFGGRKKITGESVFSVGNKGELLRKFNSHIGENYVTVKLDFNAVFYTQKESIEFSSTYQWRRIDLEELKDTLGQSGFRIIELYGDYNFGDYDSVSSRLICIAQKLK